MQAYIHGTGLISPQQTSDPDQFLPEVMEYMVDYLRCIDPNYKTYINPIAGRRMSRMIKMGITAAKIALGYHSAAPFVPDEANGLPLPDAIITGTGLGSVEDTEKILSEFHLSQGLLNPTPFIQSTYNTISSQIAISLKCHKYNSTYVHRSFSFESALQDALLHIHEGTANTALVGGIDEMTLNHLNITRKTGHWKREPVNNLKLLETKTPGSLAGEGAAFFMIGKNPAKKDYARIRNVKTLYKPGNLRDVEGHISLFLKEESLEVGDLDLVIMGINGDVVYDGIYDELGAGLFKKTQHIWYKHLCGEYYTSTGFALWLASNILKHQRIPDVVRYNDIVSSRLSNILIYNQYRNINHSLFLVSRL